MRVVTFHQITDRHHEIRLDQVRVRDRLFEYFDSDRRPARAIAEDRKQERIILHRQFELHITFTIREESRRIKRHHLVPFTDRVVVVMVLAVERMSCAGSAALLRREISNATETDQTNPTQQDHFHLTRA
jgi:hypothetical protein